MAIITGARLFVFANQRSKNRTSVAWSTARRKKAAPFVAQVHRPLGFFIAARARSPLAGAGAATPADSATTRL
jgi:hypothetical protein